MTGYGSSIASCGSSRGQLNLGVTTLQLPVTSAQIECVCGHQFSNVSELRGDHTCELLEQIARSVYD